MVKLPFDVTGTEGTSLLLLSFFRFFFPFWEGKGGRRGLSFTTQWNVLPFANVQVRDLLSNCFKTLKIYLSLMLKREFLLRRT